MGTDICNEEMNGDESFGRVCGFLLTAVSTAPSTVEVLGIPVWSARRELSIFGQGFRDSKNVAA